MLILLPPSETKAAPARRGRPVDVDGLSFAELAELRRKVLAALIETSAHPDALSLLEVGASLAPEVARNLRLESLPTSPAHAVYTGVLYEALGWSTLDAAARRLGARRVLISSALWGAVRPNDRIPPYRLSMSAELRGLGTLARIWRERLPELIAADAGPRTVVVDCRSGPYASAAPLTGAIADRTAAIRVLREDGGRRTIVSHLAKHTRGEVARYLLQTGANPRRVSELAEVIAERWPVELTPGSRGRPATIDVICNPRVDHARAPR